MSARRLPGFIDALVAGRRPGPFRADPDDAEVLRMAITLRAARPGDAIPDEQFVSDLYDTLADQASPRVVPFVRPAKMARGRAALLAVAASVALVGGSVVVTDAVNQPAVQTAAVAAPHGQELRTATFETPAHQVMGQIVVYRGQPSWVYMNIAGSNYSGPIVCMLRSNDGSTVAVGNWSLHDGSGEFSKSIGVDVSHLRGARLVTPDGTVVASATFA